MATKEKAIHDAKTGEWRILVTDKEGNEKVRPGGVVPDIEKMDEMEAVQVFQGLVSKAENRRRASVSLLCAILQHSLAQGDAMKAHQGQGNRESGQLSSGLREDFRTAENAYFEQFMRPEHAAHKTFVSRLPKQNEKGQPLELEGKPNVRERLAYFITSLRGDSNYAVAKNLVLKFFHFVGNLPYDEKGHIIPPEIMRVMIAQELDVKPRDNSYAARLTVMIRELINPANPEKPTVIEDDRLPMLLQDAKALVAELDRLSTLAAERAQARAKPGDVKSAADTAMDSARASLYGDKREATPPSDQVVKSEVKSH